MLVIGLGHKARHGKDTFAAAVQGAFGHKLDIRLASFADPLRQEVREAAEALWNTHKQIAHDFCGDLIPPFDPQGALRMLCKVHGIEFEENAPVDADYPWGKQRKLHQYWGTDYRRAQDQEYWTKKGIEVIRNAHKDGADALFFRDMRFPNEYDLIGDLNLGQLGLFPEISGWRIKVMRLGFVSDVPEHISETALDHHDFDLRLGVKDGELGLLQDLSVAMFKRLARL